MVVRLTSKEIPLIDFGNSVGLEFAVQFYEDLKKVIDDKEVLEKIKEIHENHYAKAKCFSFLIETLFDHVILDKIETRYNMGDEWKEKYGPILAAYGGICRHYISSSTKMSFPTMVKKALEWGLM